MPLFISVGGRCRNFFLKLFSPYGSCRREAGEAVLRRSSAVRRRRRRRRSETVCERGEIGTLEANPDWAWVGPNKMLGRWAHSFSYGPQRKGQNCRKGPFNFMGSKPQGFRNFRSTYLYPRGTPLLDHLILKKIEVKKIKIESLTDSLMCWWPWKGATSPMGEVVGSGVPMVHGQDHVPGDYS